LKRKGSRGYSDSKPILPPWLLACTRHLPLGRGQSPEVGLESGEVNPERPIVHESATTSWIIPGRKVDFVNPLRPEKACKLLVVIDGDPVVQCMLFTWPVLRECQIVRDVPDLPDLPHRSHLTKEEA